METGIVIVNGNGFGERLRHWRRMRGISQLDLSLRAGVSSRHLSFLETGRSQPSREMVVQLCEHLDVPLRERNDLLRLAGFASVYPENDLDGPALEPFRQIIAQLLRNHEPYPAFVLDRHWYVVDANEPARRMVPELSRGRANMVDLFLAPGSWREQIENFAEVAWTLVATLRRELAAAGRDEELSRIIDTAVGFLRDVPSPPIADDVELIVCPRLRLGEQIIRTVSTIAHFGTARDVTLSELRVEFLCPADRESEAFFRRMSDAGWQVSALLADA